MTPTVKRRLAFPPGSTDEESEIENLERGLLPQPQPETVLYAASFEENEDGFIKYQSAQWLLSSLLLVLALGIGLFMLLYLPVRRYIWRKDIRSRKLYLTPDAIVYKVRRPEAIPCLGELKKEKYIPLPSVADVVVEQGYLQSLFGVYSLRIENVGVRKPSSDDVQIQGIINPNAFRKAVLMRVSSMRSEAASRKLPATEDIPNLRLSQPSSTWMSPSKVPRLEYSGSADSLMLQKLEELGNSVKRIENRIVEQQSQSSDQ